MEWAMEIINRLAAFDFTVALIISFGVGLATSFNPCMLGMASSVMAFQNESTMKSQLPIIIAFMLSFTMTLTLLGVVSSFFGEQMIRWNEHYGSVLYQILAMVFILIGCYVVGIRFRHVIRWLPFKVVGFYSKKVKKQSVQPAHPVVKASSLGTIFGLTPSPCTTPMVMAMLAYTTATGSITLGGLLLFAYGFGHSAPFLIVGWVNGVVRRSRWMGRWQRVVNKGIGFGLILIGVYFYLSFSLHAPM